jgi:phosphoenolpyruvate-protein kinase (PTS system EI component)
MPNRIPKQLSIVPHNPLAPRIFKGKGNGIWAVTKVAPVQVHEHYSAIDVKERVIGEHEIPGEIEKLERLRVHFAPQLDHDGADVDPFLYVAADIIGQAKASLPINKVSAETMLCRLFQAHLDIAQKEIDKNQRAIDELNVRINTLMLSKDGDKGARYRKEEKIESQVEGLIIMYRQAKNVFSDTKNMLERMIGYLQTSEKEAPKPEPSEPEAPPRKPIHVAQSLTWTEIQRAFEAGAGGYIFDSSAVGVITHPFIFGHARGMPMVTLPEALRHLLAGCQVALDSRTGEIFLNPNEATIKALERRGHSYSRLVRLLREHAHVNHTLDGKQFPHLQLNIKDRDDFAHLKGQEAGLFRLEGLYLESRPNLFYLVRVIKQAISAANMVNFRLFDVATDKLPGFFTVGDIESVKSTKGGIDFLLHTGIGRSILDDQLRALLIAYDRLDHLGKVEGKTVRIILPMVSSPDEIREFKQVLGEIENELIKGPLGERVSSQYAAGAMIETSAAVANIDQIMTEIKYATIGGNDLACDLLGLKERIKLMTRLKYDWLSPTVLDNDRRIIKSAHYHGNLIGSCGEQSRDPLAAIMLTLMGIDALSMDYSYRPEINFVLSNIDLGQWEDFAQIDADNWSVVERACKLPNALAVRQFMFELITTKAEAATRMNLADIIPQACPLTYDEAA